MRQGARFLIGPLVGVAVVSVALAGCGSSSSDVDSVVSPPTTAATAISDIDSVTTAESTTSTTVEATSTTMPPTSAAPTPAPNPAPTTAPPVPQTTPVPSPPAMSAQELAALEAELTQIDAILAELSQNFAAD